VYLLLASEVEIMAVKKQKAQCGNMLSNSHCGGGLYGVGFIGAATYYIYTATGFWMGVWGVVKAIVWPAIVVYGLLKGMGA